MNVFSMLHRAIQRNRVGVIVTAALLTLLAPSFAWAQGADTLPNRVGRLSSYSGEIYLAPEDQADDWSPIELNYPVTSGDNVWAAEGARAELEFGGTRVRMAESTNINVANLGDRNIELFVAQGSIIVRFNAIDADDSVVIDTPTTQIALVQPGLYRIDVSPDQQNTALSVRTGEATAQVSAGLQQVLAGMTASIANGPTTAASFSAAYPLDAFDTWSADRERYFAQAGTVTTYVSPEMVGYADLARYGAWQSSPDYGNVWYPSDVDAGWAPYSDGYWTTVSGFGLTWVDRAPWGYAPFHYGRWAHIRGRWGWLPGNYVARPVWAPALVAWTGGGISISVSGGGPVYGWVPLGWREPYRPWWHGCSGSCWDRYNRPYHVDERDRDRYRDHAPPPDRYANWHVPGAVSAVAGSRLIARKPYAGRERVSLTGAALTSARPADSAPRLAKPAANRIPTVRPGSQGTPRPASTFYATSKPAQMGLQRHGNARLGNGQQRGSANQQILDARRTQSGQPAAGTPLQRAGPNGAQAQPQPGSPAARNNAGAPAASRQNNAAPRMGTPQQNNAAPRAGTPQQNNAAPRAGTPQQNDAATRGDTPQPRNAKPRIAAPPPNNLAPRAGTPPQDNAASRGDTSQPRNTNPRLAPPPQNNAAPRASAPQQRNVAPRVATPQRDVSPHAAPPSNAPAPPMQSRSREAPEAPRAQNQSHGASQAPEHRAQPQQRATPSAPQRVAPQAPQQRVAPQAPQQRVAPQAPQQRAAPQAPQPQAAKPAPPAQSNARPAPNRDADRGGNGRADRGGKPERDNKDKDKDR